MRPRSMLVAALASTGWTCGEPSEGVPDGALAVVGDRVIEPEDLAGLRTQLGAYAQRRFRGSEGQMALLTALIDAELLAQEAQRHGLGDDPRVRWAVLEELAALQLNAELERRVPWAEVAGDRAALRAFYDAHPEQFRLPERRAAEGVVVRSFRAADELLARLRKGTTTLQAEGTLVSTELQARDDREFPGLHPILFGPALRTGDLLPEPVLVGDALLVGRVKTIEPERLEPLDDPTVQQRLIEAVRAPKLERAREQLLQELAVRYPEQPP